MEGKYLLKGDKSLQLVTNGPGGMFIAMKNTMALDFMKKEKIKYVHFVQGENLAIKVCDPIQIG